MHQPPAALLTWVLPRLANLTAVRLYYIISDFPICKWADLFLQAQGGLWNTHCICSLLEWSWILWQKPGGRVKDGHLLHCHRWMLLGAFFLQSKTSESDTRSCFFPPALPASLSASSRKYLAFCQVGFAPQAFLFLVTCSQKGGWEGERVSKITRMFIPTLL